MQVAIMGATGTLGQALLRRFPDAIAFSRDELKQQMLKLTFPEAKWMIGDIRDFERVLDVLKGVDHVFHVAALKHIDVIEFNPIEAFKTNIQGTINIAKACIQNGVPYCSFSSTDKAVHPVNAYGHTKALCESYLRSLNGNYGTVFSIFRWGNVFGSRGSAVISFANSLKTLGTAKITHKDMTRFWIHIEDAVDFMLAQSKLPGIHIPAMKASKVSRVIDAIADALGVQGYHVETIGIRPGEKIHETINIVKGKALTSENAEQFSNRELQELVARVI